MAVSSSAPPSSNRGRWAAGQQQGLERDRRRPGADGEQLAGRADQPGAVPLGGDGRAGGAVVAGQPVQLGLDPVGPPGGGEHLAVRVLQGGAGGAALVDDDQHRPEGPVAVGGQAPPPGRHRPRHLRHRQVGQGGLVVGVVDDHLVHPGRRRRPVEPSVAGGGGQRAGERRELVGDDPDPPAGPVGLGARARSAQTSGGVMCSLPGQNGQPSGPRGVPTSARNASGLAARPAVIATQPPPSGSWRSSPGALGSAGGGRTRVMAPQPRAFAGPGCGQAAHGVGPLRHHGRRPGHGPATGHPWRQR